MKPTELEMLWVLVRNGEKRPLPAADMTLLLRIRFALQEHERATKANSERRCGICGVPVNRCCC